jgi:YspA, cpYpsA-related SLOG family
MRVLVCGSRSWKDARRIRQRLAELPRSTIVIHGEARGADALADAAARGLGLTVMTFPADWSRGKQAGFERNIAMLDEKPDLVIAFWDGKSKGTAHTIDQAIERGIAVEVIHP